MKLLKALGVLAAALFIFGSLYLGNHLDGYNALAQTVSEIGQQGSPFYSHWQILGLSVGAMLLAFGARVIVYAKRNALNVLPGVLIVIYGLSQLFIAVFPSPHALHNVFGLSMILGYLSPLVFALAWKNKLTRQFKMVSLAAFAVVLLGVFLNLSPIFLPELYPLDYYGLVQRFLLYSFYLYLAYISFTLIRTASAKQIAMV